MYALTLTAELAGVTNLRPSDTKEDPFQYTFKVQCTSCREVHDKWITVNRFETSDRDVGKGEHNLVWTCKNCKRTSHASIVAAPTAYEASDTAKPQKILELDLRGLEFVEFKPDGIWLVDGAESGTKFTDIDLTDGGGEWYDYDEKAGEEVSITGLKWELRRV